MSDPVTWDRGAYTVTCPHGCGWSREHTTTRYLRARLDEHLKTCKKKGESQ